MILALPFLVSAGGPGVPKITVAFSEDGKRVAVERTWIGDGSGLPNARIEIVDLTTSTRLADASEHALPESPTSATAAARAKVGAALDGIDLTRPAAAVPCERGRCVVSTGCSGRTIEADVRSVPTGGASSMCMGLPPPERPEVTVEGIAWTAPPVAEPCPSGFHARAVYPKGSHAVLVVDYRAPGHEGPGDYLLVLTGSTRR